MRVKNRSWSDRILEVAGRVIVMPARGVAELSNEEEASPELRREIEDGSLIVLPQTPAVESGPRPSRKAGRGGEGNAEAGGG